MPHAGLPQRVQERHDLSASRHELPCCAGYEDARKAAAAAPAAAASLDDDDEDGDIATQSEASGLSLDPGRLVANALDQ
jgi:hypothetical protein